MNIHTFINPQAHAMGWRQRAVVNASFIDKRRLAALCKEAIQLVNNHLHANGHETFWQVTHTQHPCSIWAARQPENVVYLLQYACTLLDQMQELDWDTDSMKRALEKAEEYARFAGIAEPDDDYLPTPPNCARNAGLGLDYTTHDLSIDNAYRYYMTQRWLGDIKGHFMPRWVDTVPRWLEEINPKLYTYLCDNQSGPLKCPPHDPAMYFCPILGQPIAPHPDNQAAPVIRRRIIGVPK